MAAEKGARSGGRADGLMATLPTLKSDRLVLRPLVVTHGFGELGLRRISADTDPDNAASNALLEKLGFQREGYWREEWTTHPGVRDSIIRGLLKREWDAN